MVRLHANIVLFSTCSFVLCSLCSLFLPSFRLSLFKVPFYLLFISDSLAITLFSVILLLALGFTVYIFNLSCTLVSYGYCYKLQTWWLKTKENYSLMKSETNFIGLKSRCWQGHTPLRSPRGEFLDL